MVFAEKPPSLKNLYMVPTWIRNTLGSRTLEKKVCMEQFDLVFFWQKNPNPSPCVLGGCVRC